MTESKPSPSEKPAGNAGFHRYPFYSPRFWHGMRPATWFGLLRSGRCRIHPSRIGILIGVTIATPFNTLMAGIQWLIFRRQLAEAELHGPPVFIVGHWRSGTTLLHELMVRDERLSSPSTYQCFAPSHFLISQWFFRRFANWLLPGKRPMDNMAAGWERPQEDEFALLTLGLPSPYRRIAFPNEGPADMDYLDFEGVPPADIKTWLQGLRSFLLRVSISTGRPLIIKSPTHTGRIAQLAAEFPDAKFIHITRDPRDLYPSTMRLWKGLDEVQALQQPDESDLDQYVVDCFQRMYGAFHRDRDQLPSGRLMDVRYEDLVADPVAVLRNIYQSLHLSDFDAVCPVIEEWVESEHRGYQPNKHQLEPATEAMIRGAWKEYFDRYGY
ncbi:Sulfotransferase domain protein [Rubripirellula lacrimiformis]|uniref:Sulfotransferase domain protein n=1 Tax=Rubripirellula lacrimiformis TaxID=1930273 RepID=A0A517N648_9BACT|nr:sulfotransferase [Rubripirellula lacrimiformis]QDT02591.1 Sulfotransferase domain protein [Rubripirellula lacrimiformis]